MDAHGYASCCPRRVDPLVRELPLIDFSSGYVRRALDRLPRQGSAAPWRLHQNYVIDRWALARSRVDDPAMEFSRRASRSIGWTSDPPGSAGRKVPG
jgi:hypothetical protein